MAHLTPTTCSQRLREADGFVGGPVEERRGPRTTKDWLGCIDLIMLDAVGAPLFIQTTSADHLASRVRRVMAAPHLERILQAGQLEVHGWYPDRKRVRVVTVLDADGCMTERKEEL